MGPCDTHVSPVFSLNPNPGYLGYIQILKKPQRHRKSETLLIPSILEKEKKKGHLKGRVFKEVMALTRSLGRTLV